MGFFYYRRRMTRRTLLSVLAFSAAAAALTAALFATTQMRPILESLATTRASNMVNRIVSEAVDEAIESGNIRYSDLITFEKDHEGRITAIYSNMAAFNRLQSRILDIVLTRIDQVSTRELSIPVGSLTGSVLLAGRGPSISVRMESVGSSSANFENEFTSAGINQTKHQIVLKIDVTVSILLPGFSTATTVSNAVTVAETVIVGSVPDTYTYFNSTSEIRDAKDYVLD